MEPKKYRQPGNANLREVMQIPVIGPRGISGRKVFNRFCEDSRRLYRAEGIKIRMRRTESRNEAGNRILTVEIWGLQ